MQLNPAPELVARFADGLDRLVPVGGGIGIAVSGGADSTALLLLAAAARPGLVEAATVDHGLRPEGRAEAVAVAGLCGQLGVPHATLVAQWDKAPATAVQERARDARYRLLGEWVAERSLPALATAHHLDDQAETFVMRLARGSGVRGLSAMRPLRSLAGGTGTLVRPLLGWRRGELEDICKAAGIDPVADPSNADGRFERVRIRNALADAAWLPAEAIARSAASLAAADAALDWSVDRAWRRSVRVEPQRIAVTPGDMPLEICRRIVARAIDLLATEGEKAIPGGHELDRLVESLASGKVATLRGVRCAGGEEWAFEPARPRRQV